MKVAGHELKGLMSYFKCNIKGLCFPLCCLVEYRGYCLVAMSILPISGKTLGTWIFLKFSIIFCIFFLFFFLFLYFFFWFSDFFLFFFSYIFFIFFLILSNFFIKIIIIVYGSNNAGIDVENKSEEMNRKMMYIGKEYSKNFQLLMKN